MTNKEAIDILEKEVKWLNFRCGEDPNGPIDKLLVSFYKKNKDALYIAISALKSVCKDITVHTENDHFREVKKMIPLTIEELRKMDGQPVLLVFDFELDPMTALVEYAEAADCIILTNNLGGRSEFYSDEELKESGIKVYAYPPAHIDREAWKICKECEPRCGNCVDSDADEDTYPITCQCCVKHNNYRPRFKYCSECGKPMTEEAWAELEKRLRGITNG